MRSNNLNKWTNMLQIQYKTLSENELDFKQTIVKQICYLFIAKNNCFTVHKYNPQDALIIQDSKFV